MRVARACLSLSSLVSLLIAGAAAAQSAPPAAPAPPAPEVAPGPPVAAPAAPPEAAPPLEGAAPPQAAPPLEVGAPAPAAPAPLGPPPFHRPPPAVAPPTSAVHTHDGFFARVQLGVASTTFRIDGVPGTFSQGNAQLNLQLGGALSPHVILFGELFGNTDGRFSAPGAPAATPGNDQSGATVGGIGVGAAYCFMPVNVCLTGTVGQTSVTPTGVLAMRRVRKQTEPGGAIKLGVTKEWWIGNDFGLGVALQFLGTGAMRDTDPYANIPDPVWHASSVGLLASITYN
jgi:hypothetical protein